MPPKHLILYCPFLLLPSVFPSIRVFSSELSLHIRQQSIEASASASVLPMNVQGWVPLDLTGLISLQSKGLSRVFFNTTVQKINSLALSLLYAPTLTLIHDYWKKHSFDSMDLCWQSNASAFSYAVQVGHSFSSKEQVHFNFMATVTICSDMEPRK